MGVIRINTGFGLPSDATIDIALLQWKSADPVDVNALTEISESEVKRKRLTLERVAETIRSRPRRLTILLAPELSMPVAFRPILDDFASGLQRPLIFAFGFEVLTPSAYDQLAQNVDRVASFRSERSLINAAALWLVNEECVIKRFLQPKRWVSKHEHKFSEGDETFVFTSPTSDPGERLNFLMSVCSDFTNPANVKVLRQEVLAAKVANLDFAFVLQMNKQQDALEFCEGARAYFAPPFKLTETSNGTLIFVNNAGDAPGNFGDSKFHFAHRRVHFPDKAPPTFRVEERDLYNFDSAVFRDCDSSLYAVTYRPHYLVDQTAGSTERTPFEKAIHSSLTGDLLQPLALAELPAVTHWVRTEITHQCGDRKLRAASQFHRDPSGNASRQWMGAAGEATDWWLAAAGDSDELARRAIQTLFRWDATSPIVHKLKPEPEPTRWLIRESFHRTIDAVTLIRLAVLPSGSLQPKITKSSHAIAFGRPLVFLAGGGNVPATNIIEGFKTEIGIDAAVDDDLVVVLAEHRGGLQHHKPLPPSPPDDMTAGYAEGMDADATNFTRTGIKAFAPLSADMLYAELCDAATFEQGLERLRQTVKDALD